MQNTVYDPARYSQRLDPGIERAVHLFNCYGIETCESCEGGTGHAFAEPTVRTNLHAVPSTHISLHSYPAENVGLIVRLCNEYDLPLYELRVVQPVWLAGQCGEVGTRSKYQLLHPMLDAVFARKLEPLI